MFRETLIGCMFVVGISLSGCLLNVDTAYVSVKVVDSNGDPVEGAELEMQMSRDGIRVNGIHTDTTDQEGNAEFIRDTDAGSIDLIIDCSKPGFKEYNGSHLIHVNGIENSNKIKIELESIRNLK